jgi:hypothetical protein
MKARKVTITLEVLTVLPIKTLRDRDPEWWKEGMIVSICDEDLEIVRVQVDVTKPSK